MVHVWHMSGILTNLFFTSIGGYLGIVDSQIIGIDLVQ